MTGASMKGDDDSRPPSSAATSRATEMESRMRDLGIIPATFILPTGDGGLVFEKHTTNATEKVVFDADGSAEYVSIRDGQILLRQIWAHPEPMTAKGSVSGQLVIDASGPLSFHLQPPGTIERVSCKLNPSHWGLASIADGHGLTVTVHGTLAYEDGRSHPVSIDADSIEVHPPDEELSDLLGALGMENR